MGRAREAYDPSVAPSERSNASDHAQQTFSLFVSGALRAGYSRFHQSRLTKEAFDILHKQPDSNNAPDYGYKSEKTLPVRRKFKPKDSTGYRREPMSIVSTYNYHIMLESIQEAPRSTDSWMYDRPQLNSKACIKCRRSFGREDNRPICDACATALPKWEDEYHSCLKQGTRSIELTMRSSFLLEALESDTASTCTSTISMSERRSSLYHTDASSTITSSSYDDAPSATVLISRSGVRVFPGLSYFDILNRLAGAGLDITPIYREGKAYKEAKPNNESSANSDSRSFTSSLAPKGSGVAKSTKSGSSGRTGGSQSSGSTKPSNRRRTKKRVESTRFGCPFAKRSPCRYEKVFGSCTLPEGMEMKYVVEHLDRVHSGRTACPWCKQKWAPNTSWIDQLLSHTLHDPCLDAEELLSKPEPLSETQQIALDTYKTERHTEPETQRWVNLFMALFPGEFPIPSPFYDFYTLTHMIRPSAGAQSPAAGSQTGSMEGVLSSAMSLTGSQSTLQTMGSGGDSVHTTSRSASTSTVPMHLRSPMILATADVDELENLGQLEETLIKPPPPSQQQQQHHHYPQQHPMHQQQHQPAYHGSPMSEGAVSNEPMEPMTMPMTMDMGSPQTMEQILRDFGMNVDMPVIMGPAPGQDPTDYLNSEIQSWGNYGYNQGH